MKLLQVASLAMLLAVGVGCPARAQYDGYGDPYYGQDGGRDDRGYDDGYADDGRPGDDAPDPSEYESALSPYGSWVDDPSYGRVWYPQVAAGWAPYTDGYWAWTNWGWSWTSYGPWAWTFHYGRWSWAPVFGWVWVPGSVWGPAWVDWYWGSGWVGWAPLAPFGGIGINHYVFVNERDFCSPHVNRWIVRDRQIPHFVREDFGRRRFVRPPDYDRIRQVSVNPVQRFDRRPIDTIAPWKRPGATPRFRRDVPASRGVDRGPDVRRPGPRFEREGTNGPGGFERGRGRALPRVERFDDDRSTGSRGFWQRPDVPPSRGPTRPAPMPRDRGPQVFVPQDRGPRVQPRVQRGFDRPPTMGRPDVGRPDVGRPGGGAPAAPRFDRGPGGPSMPAPFGGGGGFGGGRSLGSGEGGGVHRGGPHFGR